MSPVGERNLYINDAQFYDLDNRKIVKVDIPFYLNFAKKTEVDILELACGTGRLTIPLAEAGNNVWGLEYSETMLNQFKYKMEQLPESISQRIKLIHGDMSQFSLNRSFPLIILPNRSFQLLLEDELENSCLQTIRRHLNSNGDFIINIGNFIKSKEMVASWVDDTEFFDWENTDPNTGFNVRRSHIRKEIDSKRQIIFPYKTYRITKKDGSTETITKRSPWRYFFYNQIKEKLISNGFRIIHEFGSYEGDPISKEGPEFIFICRKD
jgi:SAM-dependent methyltransferase